MMSSRTQIIQFQYEEKEKSLLEQCLEREPLPIEKPYFTPIRIICSCPNEIHDYGLVCVIEGYKPVVIVDLRRV